MRKLRKASGILLIAVLLLMNACISESAPDGSVYSAYSVKYDQDALSGWQTMRYYEPSGLLLSAFTDTAEITVSVNERGSSQSAEGYIKNYLSNVSRYGKVIDSGESTAWNDPIGSGGTMREYTYMYTSGGDTDEVYFARICVAPLSSNYYFVVVLNAWGGDRDAIDEMFMNRFLPACGIETVQVSTVYTAYFKRAAMENGRLSAELDFCTVEFDANIFAVYIDNEDPTGRMYAFRDDAVVIGPDVQSVLYSMKTLPVEEESLQRMISDYQAAAGMDAIFQVLFNQQNEIIWMMHYNAY